MFFIYFFIFFSREFATLELPRTHTTTHSSAACYVAKQKLLHTQN
jgi:hypothetical protein